MNAVRDRWNFGRAPASAARRTADRRPRRFAGFAPTPSPRSTEALDTRDLREAGRLLSRSAGRGTDGL